MENIIRIVEEATHHIEGMFSASIPGSAIKSILHRYDQEQRLVKEDLIRFLKIIGKGDDINENEIKEKMKLLGIQNEVFDLYTFFTYVTNELENYDKEEEVLNAFKVFDKEESGFINVSELRLIMTNLGDKLTDDEVDQMIRKSDLDGDGQINYEEFVRKMLQTNNLIVSATDKNEQ